MWCGIEKFARVPLTGAPSINSNLARVSVSTYVLGPDPVDSRRLISSSIFFSLILTRRKYILPIMTSFKWYLYILKSNINTSVSFQLSVKLHEFHTNSCRELHFNWRTCFYCIQIQYVDNPQPPLPSRWTINTNK